MERRILYLGILLFLLIGTCARPKEKNKHLEKKPLQEEESDGYLDICIATDKQTAHHIQKVSKYGFQVYFYRVLIMAQFLLKTLDPNIHLRYKGAAFYGAHRHLGLVNFVDKELFDNIYLNVRMRGLYEADGKALLANANEGIFKQLWKIVQDEKHCDVIFWVAFEDWLMKFTQADGITKMYSICTDKAHGILELQENFNSMVLLMTHEVAHILGVYHDLTRPPFPLDGVINDSRIKDACLSRVQYGCKSIFDCVMGTHPSWPRRLVDVKFSNCSVAYFHLYLELTRTTFVEDVGDEEDMYYSKSCFMKETEPDRLHLISFQDLANKN